MNDEDEPPRFGRSGGNVIPTISEAEAFSQFRDALTALSEFRDAHGRVLDLRPTPRIESEMVHPRYVCPACGGRVRLAINGGLVDTVACLDRECALAIGDFNGHLTSRRSILGRYEALLFQREAAARVAELEADRAGLLEALNRARLDWDRT